MSLNPRNPKQSLKEFSNTLTLPKKKSAHPILIAPFGPCLIGKTTTMRYLAKRLPVVHIEHDRLRAFLKNKRFNQKQIKKILYDKQAILEIAFNFIKQEYSVIVDRNFATNHQFFLRTAKRRSKLHKIKFFLIKIWAPHTAIIQKIKTMRFKKPYSSGGLPDRKTGIECYEYARKKYKKYYEKLTPQAFTTIDTSRHLPRQLKNTIEILKKEIG